MIITSQEQERLLNQFQNKNKTFLECEAFIDGMTAIIIHINKKQRQEERRIKDLEVNFKTVKPN
jgi:hypothetical protein